MHSNIVCNDATIGVEQPDLSSPEMKALLQYSQTMVESMEWSAFPKNQVDDHHLITSLVAYSVPFCCA